jgi:hypothetical protein
MFVDGWKPAFVVWSDIAGINRGGNKLFSFLEKTFPDSEVLKTKPARNPNSPNQICLYSWQVPRDEFKTWWEENK